MMLTTAQLRAAHDALHRLIACGESGDTDYTDADAHAVYDKVCAELRKRDRRSSRSPRSVVPANEPGQPQPAARRRR
jgi:hypothetical protein